MKALDVRTARTLAMNLVDGLRASTFCAGAKLFWLDATRTMLVQVAAAGSSVGRGPTIAHPGQGTIGVAFSRRELVVERNDGPGEVFAVPICIGDAVSGVLSGVSESDVDRSQVGETTARFIASSVSAELSVLELLVESNFAAEKYASIASLMRSYPTDDDLEHASDRIGEIALRMLGADYTAVARHEAEGFVTYHGCHGTRSSKWSENLPTYRPASAAAERLRAGDAIVVHLDPNAEAQDPFGQHAGQKDGTVLIVPIVTKTGHIGDLVAGWRLHVAPHARLIAFAEALAAHAATVLSEASRRNDALETARRERARHASAVALAELRTAIAMNRLHLMYQPIFDLATGQMVQCEALCRWPSAPTLFASPDRFIRLAEDHGLIDALTERVVIMALRDWREMPAHVRLAINVSTLNLVDPRFGKTLLRLLRTLHCAPDRLSIELTETALLRDGQRENARQMAAEISGSGVQVSIDDFGEGLASFTYLKMFGATSIKIDRSFITQIVDNGVDFAIVRSIIDLAHHLNISVTAEGVEDDGALDVVRNLGCDLVQGYGCARPMSVSSLASFVRTGAHLDARVALEQRRIASG